MPAMNKNIRPAILVRQLTILAAIMVANNPACYAAEPEIPYADEIVVTATRTVEDPWSIPEPVEIISQQTIQEESATSIGELLHTLTGVSISGSGLWETTPVIRGMGSNRVLVLIDGDNETNLWAGREPLTLFIDLGSIERIEILKGPASVLYGTDALGDVINIITKKPAFSKTETWTFTPYGEISYSSNDSGKYGDIVLDAATDDVAIRLEASSRDNSSYKDSNGDRVPNSQFKGSNFRVSLIHKGTSIN